MTRSSSDELPRTANPSSSSLRRAFASTAFLMRYFRRHDAWALNPFAYYCIALGLGSLTLLLFVV